MTKLPPPMHSRTIDIVSYVLVAAMIAAVLWLHLLPAAIAGFLVYALARKLEVRLRERRTLSKSAKAIAVGGVFLIAALILAGLGIGIGRLVEHGHGLEGMLTRIADVLDNLRESLPAAVVDYVPQSVSELRVQLVQMLKEHGHQVSTIGIDGLACDPCLRVQWRLTVVDVEDLATGLEELPKLRAKCGSLRRRRVERNVRHAYRLVTLEHGFEPCQEIDVLGRR